MRSKGKFYPSLAVVTLLAVLVVPGCAPAAVPPQSTEAPVLASNEEMAGWIEDIASFGFRRPGSPAYYQTENYLVDKLQGFGITDIERQPYEIDYWVADEWGLTVGGEEIPCCFTAMSNVLATGPEGITRETVYLGDAAEEDLAATDVADKIIVMDVRFVAIPGATRKLFAIWYWDPDDTLSAFEGLLTYLLPNWHTAYGIACEKGAAALVGILADYPTNENRYYMPYQGPLSHQYADWIPGLWVGKDDGAHLRELIADAGGSAEAHLVLTGTVTPETTVHNIVATLPGMTDDIIVVHSHYDGPWYSAIEDASGCAEVLAIARYFAQVPQAERQKTLVFLFSGGHFAGPAKGTSAFVQQNPELMERVMLDICIEHIAQDFDAVDGEWVDTGMPEPRQVFVAGGDEAAVQFMVDTLARAVERHDLRRLMVFPGDSPVGVPTDAHAFHQAEYPIYSYISGPEYLFDPCDTIDMVAIDELNPVASAWIDVITELDEVPASQLTGNAAPSE